MGKAYVRTPIWRKLLDSSPQILERTCQRWHTQPIWLKMLSSIQFLERLRQEWNIWLLIAIIHPLEDLPTEDHPIQDHPIEDHPTQDHHPIQDYPIQDPPTQDILQTKGRDTCSLGQRAILQDSLVLRFPGCRALNIALRCLPTAELNLGTGILPSNGRGGQHCLHKHRDLIQTWTRAYIGFPRSLRGDTTKEIKNF